MEYRIEFRIKNLEFWAKVIVFVFILYSIFQIPNSAQAAIIINSSSYTSIGGNSSLNNGLVGHWTFDGDKMKNNVTDSSGSGNNGYMFGFTSTSSAITAGKIGQGLNLINNSGSYIKSGLTFSDTFSYSLFIYPRSQANVTNEIIGVGTDYDNSARHIWINGNNNTLNFISQAGGGIYNKPFSYNKWTHIVAINDSTNNLSYLYMDGVLIATSTALVTTQTVVSTIIGNSAYSGYLVDHYYSGILDDVRIYNRALSVAEIKQLYLQGQVTMQATQGGASQGPAFSSLNNGLVGYWTFNNQDMNWATGKALDKSGSGNDGQIIGMSTTTNPTQGKIGQGLKFDGVNNYVNVGLGQNGSLDITSNITMSAWVKPISYISATMDGIIVKCPGMANDGYGLGYYSSGSIVYKYGLNAVGFSLDKPIIYNVWQHITVVWNGTNALLYINGVLADTKAGGNPTAVASPLTVGARYDNNYRFNGYLDDTRIYNRALSATEVKQLYLQGQVTMQATQGGASQGPAFSSLNNGLVGYWTFNNQDMNWATGKALDKSGSGNDGQIMNMSTTTSPVQGKMGQGLKFDGTYNKYVNIGNPSVLQFTSGTNSFTVAAWFKKTANADNNTVIMKQGLTNNLSYGLIGNMNGTFSFRMGKQSVGSDNVTSDVISNGVWHYAVGVYTASTNGMQLYIDGTAPISGTYTMGNLTSDNSLALGNDVGGLDPGDNRAFNGLIDDVRVYNRALSAAEIRQLYIQGSGKIPPILCGTYSVTGQDGLTYGTVVGADGKCWLDRNLGATQVATSKTDTSSYGSYYQWGRLTDGHQIPTSGVTSTGSNGDVPNNGGLFISTTTSPDDWHSPQNNNLWQGVNGTNNPCPTGFRVPTKDEWVALISAASITNKDTAYSSTLKIPVAGYRHRHDGSFFLVGSFGIYWSSSPLSTYAYNLFFGSGSADPADSENRADGYSVRCVKD
jgi:uncharacterized protein (TIGR02145 family)